jgi:hypothetical protein
MVPTGALRLAAIDSVTRERVPGDDGFIYNSYLRSYHERSTMKHAPHRLYFKPQANVLTFLLREGRALVACYPEDPNEILGYILFQHTHEALVLHYVYGKLHGMGIRSGLIRAAAGAHQLAVLTHMCDGYQRLRKKMAGMGIGVVYDPFLLHRLMANE